MMDFMEWYTALAKPSWTPDPTFIGTMWSILYPIIIVTFAYVFVQGFRKKLPSTVVVPFVVNLISNVTFTPIQFGLRNLPLTSVAILICWGTIIWMIISVWNHNRLIGIAQLPYLAWVSVATVLQLTITFMNLG
tara:strand:+ start:555 stop:956 length:402 start_codon:yes stop_codon:yes gene_type:complete